MTILLAFCSTVLSAHNGRVLLAGEGQLAALRYANVEHRRRVLANMTNTNDIDQPGRRTQGGGGWLDRTGERRS